jgi:hypothetical protein
VDEWEEPAINGISTVGMVSRLGIRFNSMKKFLEAIVPYDILHINKAALVVLSSIL